MNSQTTPSTSPNRVVAGLAASRFFTFSLLIHVALMIVLGGTVLYRMQETPPDFVADSGGFLVDAPADTRPVEEPTLRPTEHTTAPTT